MVMRDAIMRNERVCYVCERRERERGTTRPLHVHVVHVPNLAACRPPPTPHARRSRARSTTADSHHATMNRGGAPSTAKPATSNTQLGLLATVLVLSGLLACKQTNGSEREDMAAWLRKP